MKLNIIRRPLLLFTVLIFTAGNCLQAQAQLPDLVPAGLTSSRIPTIGQTIGFSGTISNNSTTPINSGLTERVTLSTTPSTNGAVAHVDFGDGFNLGGNATYTTFDPYGVFKMTIPANLAPGTNYYFIFEVDVANQITESNEGNNALVIPTQVAAPDLMPLSLSTNRVPTVGQTILFSGVITNSGNGFANGGLTERVTLSTTPSTNGAVAHVDFSDGLNLNGGGSYATFDPYGVFKMTIPTNLAPGTNYYFIFEVDVANQIAESNEGNNALVVPTQVATPDLVPLSLTPKQLLTEGQTIFFTGTVTNLGNGFINGGATDRVTLSTSPSLSNEITHVDFAYGININGHGSYSPFDPYDQFKLFIPTNLPPGTNYYFIYQVDVANEVFESNETNNTLVQQAVLAAPDLAPVTFTALQPATLGQNVSFNSVITNLGDGFVNGSLTDRVTLSTTPDTNGAVVHADYSYNVNVNGHSGYSVSDPFGNFKLLVPTNIAPGTNYYFIYQVDVSNQVSESNETNNVIVKNVIVGAGDLAATSLTNITTPLAGLPLTVSYTASNPSSNNLAGVWEDRLTLSSTPTTNGAITNWSFITSRSVAGGGNYTATPALTLPQIATNIYYLILKVDTSNVVAETTGTNNTLVLPLSVGSHPPAVSLLQPKNLASRESCVAIPYTLSALVQKGSYDVTNVAFLDGTNVLNQPANLVNPSFNALLGIGAHNLSVRASDAFGNITLSTNLASITIHYPTNLNVVRGDIDANTNFVGCMCGEQGSNYVVLTTTNLQTPGKWETNSIVNNLATNILFFTNSLNDPQRFFQVRSP